MELEEIKNVLLDICIYKGDKDGLTAEEYSAIKSAGDYLTKQEKMIELMLEYLNFYGVEDDICTAELSKDCNENCKECIKQYFEKKVEEETNG